MGGAGLLDLVNRWDAGAGLPVHRRLATLLAADPDGAPLGEDSLGRRHRRLIALHEHWIDRPIEAHVACPACGTANEFVLPLAAMKAVADPPRGAQVTVADQVFRLPTMDDLAAVGPDPAALAQRCALAPGAPVDADTLAALGEAFDRIDPLARLAIDSACAECGGAVHAEVDLAEFVAAELTRFTDLLLRDIDVIAGAYGWSEAEILALPPARRARYVAMIAGRRGPRAVAGEALARETLL